MSTHLTDEMRQNGESLLRVLDTRKILARAVFWLYVAERGDWRLVIATPQLKTVGPKKIYRVLQQTLAKIHAPMPLSSITLMDSKAPLVKALSSVMRTAGSKSDIRLSGDVINRCFIEDAYIYRMAARSGRRAA